MKNMNLRLCLLLLSLCSLSTMQAQHHYRFQSTTGTYSELNNAQQLSWNDFDPNLDLYTLQELIGQTFYFYNTPFPFGGIKTCAIESNGVIRIDNDSTLIIIDAAFTYLDSIDATSSISYTIEGAPGDYIVKAQWKNLKLRVGPAGNYANMQIWVYQQTGIVEIHYDPRSANNANGYNTTSGPQVGMFFSEDDFSKCYDKLWITGSPDNLVIDSGTNYVFNAMSGVPQEGTIFRFIPRSMATGIYDYENIRQSMYVYPNPVAGDKLFISKISDYDVYTSEGHLCIAIQQNNQIDVSTLSKGIYFLRGRNGYSSRFIIP
jgi:hypothetical protein